MYWAPVLSSSDRPTFLSPFRTFQPSVRTIRKFFFKVPHLFDRSHRGHRDPARDCPLLHNCFDHSSAQPSYLAGNHDRLRICHLVFLPALGNVLHTRGPDSRGSETETGGIRSHTGEKDWPTTCCFEKDCTPATRYGTAFMKTVGRQCHS